MHTYSFVWAILILIYWQHLFTLFCSLSSVFNTRHIPRTQSNRLSSPYSLTIWKSGTDSLNLRSTSSSISTPQKQCQDSPMPIWYILVCVHLRAVLHYGVCFWTCDTYNYLHISVLWGPVASPLLCMQVCKYAWIQPTRSIRYKTLIGVYEMHGQIRPY